MQINGLPIFSPSFRIEGTNVTFSGGDLRNTILDFRKTSAEGFVVASVYCDTGCFDSGDQKHFTIGILLDKSDSRVYFDRNWVYYPGSLRKVVAGGPFATIFVVCTREGQNASGVPVAMGGIDTQTDTDGWAHFYLQGIHDRIIPVKITDPKTSKIIEKEVPVPIVCAETNYIFYKEITVELNENWGAGATSDNTRPTTGIDLSSTDTPSKNEAVADAERETKAKNIAKEIVNLVEARDMAGAKKIVDAIPEGFLKQLVKEDVDKALKQ